MRSRSGGVWPMEACGRCRPVDGWPSTGLGHRRAMPPPPTGPATARDWLKESIDDVTTRSRGVSRFRFRTTVGMNGRRGPRNRALRTHEVVAVRRSGDAPVGDQPGQDVPEGPGAHPAGAAERAAREGRDGVGQRLLDPLTQGADPRRGDAIATRAAVDHV